MNNDLHLDDINYWMRYCGNIFTQFNGKMNSVFMANSIVLGKPHYKFNTLILGSLIYDEVNINMIDILHFCRTHDGMQEENKIKTVLIFTVLHELSHCDQNIEFLRMKNDKRETLKYEIENDYNTLLFIEQNMEEIWEVGNCVFNKFVLEMVIHNQPIIPFTEPLMYRKISSPYEKIVQILSSFTDANIYQIIVNERIQDIRMNYVGYDRILRIIDIMKYGRWLPMNYNAILREIVRSDGVLVQVTVTPLQELIINVSQR